MTAAAKNRGGRPLVLVPGLAAHARRLYQQGDSVEVMARKLGVAPATLYRHQPVWRPKRLTVGVLDFFGFPVHRYNKFPDGPHPGHFDLQVIKLLALSLDVRVRFKPLGFPALLRGVETGELDTAIGMLGESPRRLRRFLFSEAYGNVGGAPNIALLARRSLCVGPEQPATFLGLRFGAMVESQSADWLMDTCPGVHLETWSRPERMYQALLDNRIDVVAHSVFEQRFFAASNPELELKTPLICYGGRTMRLLFNRENPALQEQVSACLHELRRSFALEKLEARAYERNQPNAGREESE